MKNLFISIAALSLFVAVTVFASPLATFTAQNNYSGVVGTVTVNTSAGPAYLNVSGPGAFTTQIPGTVNNVVINNYVIFQGTTGMARLANGKSIKVSWSGTNVIIINPEEAN
jgi:hypothetical protein